MPMFGTRIVMALLAVLVTSVPVSRPKLTLSPDFLAKMFDGNATYHYEVL